MALIYGDLFAYIRSLSFVKSEKNNEWQCWIDVCVCVCPSVLRKPKVTFILCAGK